MRIAAVEQTVDSGYERLQQQICTNSEQLSGLGHSQESDERATSERRETGRERQRDSQDAMKETVSNLEEKINTMQSQLALVDERPTKISYQVNVQVFMDCRKLVIWHEGGRRWPMYITAGSVRTEEDGHQYVALAACKFRAANESADVGDALCPLDITVLLFRHRIIKKTASSAPRTSGPATCRHRRPPRRGAAPSRTEAH